MYYMKRFFKIFLLFFTLAPLISHARVKNISEKHSLHLYQMMKDIHEILVNHGITYWVDFGTLLGTVRHKGQIPWDDDLDISLFDEKRFTSLKPIFEEYGYEFIQWHFGYKMFPKDPVFYYECIKFPFLDIFIAEKRKDGKIYYKYMNRYNRKMGWAGLKREKKEFFINENELFPIKKYTFGRIKVHGPNKPRIMLKCFFGEIWNKFAYKYNHMNGKKNTIKVKLTPELRKPAQPTGPLKNRVKK